MFLFFEYCCGTPIYWVVGGGIWELWWFGTIQGFELGWTGLDLGGLRTQGLGTGLEKIGTTFFTLARALPGFGDGY